MMTRKLFLTTLLLIGLPMLAAADTLQRDLNQSQAMVKTETETSTLRLADPAVIARLEAEDARNPGRPRHMTPEERRQWRQPEFMRPSLEDIPDYHFLRPQAEYEPNDAILMRWGQFNAVLTSMIVPITTGDSRARVKLIVANASQQASASSTLAAGGANLDRIDFVQAPSDSVWIRDYGPRFASADFRPIIIDHEYDRPRPLDNQVPGQIANHLDVPIYELPLAQGGGNYHSFANGEAYITDTILYFNQGTTAEQVKSLFAAYQGVDMTILGSLGVDSLGGTSFPWYDGTGHLDMWFLPIDDNTVIIGEYAETEWNGIPHQVTEDAVALMQSRGYNVLRTPGWRSNGTHFTYTNAVIVNDIVLTCFFNGYSTQNAQAQAAFEQAFPDRTIVPVNCSSIIGASGALHCTVKHMPRSDAFGNRPPYYDWGR
jgi:agmatine deiminase